MAFGTAEANDGAEVEGDVHEAQTEIAGDEELPSSTTQPSEILEAIRFTLGVVKRALLGRITP